MKLDALREKIREGLRWSVTDVKSRVGLLTLSTVAKFVAVSIVRSISWNILRCSNTRGHFAAT